MSIKPLKKEHNTEAKKRKRNIAIGLFIIFLMVFSIVGYAFLDGNFNESQKIKYNNYEFTTNGEYWQTKVKISGQEQTIITNFLPSDLENISLSGNILLSDFQNKIVYYIANNSADERNSLGILDNEIKKYYLRAQLACSEENENLSHCSNLPIKSCDDANSEILIIKINSIENSTASINYKNYCIEISGQGIDLMRASEKIIFKSYGIMN